MAHTNDLRKLIVEKLITLPGKVYYIEADPEAQYPYKVYTLEHVDLSDPTREDYSLCVDIWDRASDWKVVLDMSDAIAAMFNAANLPQDTILPTFFCDSSYPVKDSDKTIQHQQLHFTVQLNLNE